MKRKRKAANAAPPPARDLRGPGDPKIAAALRANEAGWERYFAAQPKVTDADRRALDRLLAENKLESPKRQMSARKTAVLNYARQHAGEANLVAKATDFDAAKFVGKAKTAKQRKSRKRVVERWLKTEGLLPEG